MASNSSPSCLGLPSAGITGTQIISSMMYVFNSLSDVLRIDLHTQDTLHDSLSEKLPGCFSKRLHHSLFLLAVKSQLCVFLPSWTLATGFSAVRSPVDVAGSFLLWLETRNFWKRWRFLFYISRRWELQSWGVHTWRWSPGMPFGGKRQVKGKKSHAKASVELAASSPFIIGTTHSWKWGPGTLPPPIRLRFLILTLEGKFPMHIFLEEHKPQLYLIFICLILMNTDV